MPYDPNKYVTQIKAAIDQNNDVELVRLFEDAHRDYESFSRNEEDRAAETYETKSPTFCETLVLGDERAALEGESIARYITKRGKLKTLKAFLDFFSKNAFKDRNDIRDTSPEIINQIGVFVFERKKDVYEAANEIYRTLHPKCESLSVWVFQLMAYHHSKNKGKIWPLQIQYIFNQLPSWDGFFQILPILFEEAGGYALLQIFEEKNGDKQAIGFLCTEAVITKIAQPYECIPSSLFVRICENLICQYRDNKGCDPWYVHVFSFLNLKNINEESLKAAIKLIQEIGILKMHGDAEKKGRLHYFQFFISTIFENHELYPQGVHDLLLKTKDNLLFMMELPMVTSPISCKLGDLFFYDESFWPTLLEVFHTTSIEKLPAIAQFCKIISETTPDFDRVLDYIDGLDDSEDQFLNAMVLLLNSYDSSLSSTDLKIKKILNKIFSSHKQKNKYKDFFKHVCGYNYKILENFIRVFIETALENEPTLQNLQQIVCFFKMLSSQNMMPVRLAPIIYNLFNYAALCVQKSVSQKKMKIQSEDIKEILEAIKDENGHWISGSNRQALLETLDAIVLHSKEKNISNSPDACYFYYIDRGRKNGVVLKNAYLLLKRGEPSDLFGRELLMMQLENEMMGFQSSQENHDEEALVIFLFENGVSEEIRQKARKALYQKAKEGSQGARQYLIEQLQITTEEEFLIILDGGSYSGVMSQNESRFNEGEVHETFKKALKRAFDDTEETPNVSAYFMGASPANSTLVELIAYEQSCIDVLREKHVAVQPNCPLILDTRESILLQELSRTNESFFLRIEVAFLVLYDRARFVSTSTDKKQTFEIQGKYLRLAHNLLSSVIQGGNSLMDLLLETKDKNLIEYVHAFLKNKLDLLKAYLNMLNLTSHEKGWAVSFFSKSPFQLMQEASYDFEKLIDRFEGKLREQQRFRYNTQEGSAVVSSRGPM